MSTFFGTSDKTTCKIAKVKLYRAWKTFDFSVLCVVGFEYGGDIFLKVCAHDYIENAVGVSRESGNSDNFRVRFAPSKDWKIKHIAECARLCTAEQLENFRVSRELENIGTAFECFVKNYFNIPATKDNTPFSESCDMELNGTTYSIKFERATLCNETYFINRGFTASDFETL